MKESIDSVAKLLERARSVAVLSGAGISAESGIPTFRDAQSGIWARFNPADLATVEGFLADPPLVWQWYDYRRKLLAEAAPNPGHKALVELEKILADKGVPLVVITQNVDGLHQAAGSSDVVELHGSINRFICLEGKHEQELISTGLQSPPTCFCGSLIRPAVTWFGESMPAVALSRGFEIARSCDAMLVVGTSALVQPAASLPFIAAEHNAQVIDVNPDSNPALAEISCQVLRGRSGEVLPMILASLQQLLGS